MTRPNEEEEEPRPSEEEIERGLEIYFEEDPEQYRAAVRGKITADDIISKIKVDIAHRTEDIREEGRAK